MICLVIFVATLHVRHVWKTSPGAKQTRPGSNQTPDPWCLLMQVQGVFFRQHTKEKANALGVVGWVQNTPRDTVTGEVQGEAEAAEQMKVFIYFTYSMAVRNKWCCQFFHDGIKIAYTVYSDTSLEQVYLQKEGSPPSRIDKCDISDERHDLTELSYSDFSVC